jgi:hypothetical protein
VLALLLLMTLTAMKYDKNYVRGETRMASRAPKYFLSAMKVASTDPQ